MRRVETDEAFSGEIPLEYFREGRFKDKGYIKVSVDIVSEGIKQLNIPKDEPIHVCSGYVLSGIRDYLTSHGYNVSQKKIIGNTQTYAESEFIKSLVKIGIGTTSEVEAMRSFYRYLEWIKKDFHAREKYVKTGWSSWKKWKKEINGG